MSAFSQKLRKRFPGLSGLSVWRSGFPIHSNKAVGFFYYMGGLFCVYFILSRIWVAEDAYITFRTVQNLYLGHGLVFNPGERVEASTHPLWMLGLIFVRGLGFPLHQASIALGLLFSLSSLRLLVLRDKGFGYVLPLTSLLVFTNYGVRDFATAGMEYSLVFFLLSLWVYSLDGHRLADHPFGHAFLLGLLYLSRPELALFAIYYSAFFAWELFSLTKVPGNKAPIRSFFLHIWRMFTSKAAWLWALGLLLSVAPYHIFRLLYYGEFFPNTYYAKAGLSAYYIQGLKYLAYTLFASPGLLFVLAFLGIWLAGFLYTLWQNRQNKKKPLHKQRSRLSFSLLHSYGRFANCTKSLRQATLRELGAALLGTCYIVRVGADFMAYRFLLPELFLLSLAATRLFGALGAFFIGKESESKASGISKVSSSRTEQEKNREDAKLGTPMWLRPAALFALLLSLSLWPEFRQQGWVASERWVFSDFGKKSTWELLQGAKHPWARRGARLRRLARCLNIGPLQITNSMTQAHCLPGSGLGYFGVAAGPQILILDEQGLPNRDVARLPVLYRWRPGHEHYVDLNFVLKKRALFCRSEEPVYDRIMQTPIGVILSLDREVLSTLPGVRSRLLRLAKYRDAENSPILHRLEEIYGVRLSELQKEALNWQKDPFLQQKQACWQAPLDGHAPK